jgi:hypothetical protein
LLGPTNFAMDCYGYLNIPEDGVYNFTLSSDDGSEIAIDDDVVINMPQDQDMGTSTGTATLFAGQHSFNLEYFQGLPVDVGLVLQWQGPANAGLGTTQIVTGFSHEVNP